MSTERTDVVALRADSRVTNLAADLVSAAGRALKADPGDRSDVVRYESLAVQLEQMATAALAAGAPALRLHADDIDDKGLGFGGADLTDPVGAPLVERLPPTARAEVQTWINGGHLAVVLRLALMPGATTATDTGVAAPEPQETWEAPADAQGRKAVQARFRAQLNYACEPGSGDTRLGVNPSGIHNRVLTEVLHEFVDGDPLTRRDATIVYRDGSQAAHPFPLRCLPLRDAPAAADITLHLALLSIRHTEMDHVVDGAWLRNAEVSRPRPAAQTDDFVYETSRRQLVQLTASGGRTALLHIYQTGLDTAVVGFYRAVVTHLIDHPRSLTVIPMFHARSRTGATPLEAEVTYRPGSAWSMGARS
jgi:hypothetical protein